MRRWPTGGARRRCGTRRSSARRTASRWRCSVARSTCSRIRAGARSRRDERDRGPTAAAPRRLAVRIYLRGLAGETPEHPTAWDELERRAADALEPEPRGYVCGGAGTDDTMRANLAAFRRRRLVPRMLRDVSRGAGRPRCWAPELPAPVLLAPVGVQTIVHPDGELAVGAGRGRRSACRSSPAPRPTATLEEVAEAAATRRAGSSSTGRRTSETGRSLVRPRRGAGYTAIVVTLDTIDARLAPDATWPTAYLPVPPGQRASPTHLATRSSAPRSSEPPEEDLGGGRRPSWAQCLQPGADLGRPRRLRAQTRLPILLKGILHPDDARQARRARASTASIVSNHGGRQVDGAIAALDALPGVVDAVGDGMPVLFDSGIRRGADVFKALALGADAVLLGRPYLWGLALDGAAGVETVLRMLLAELNSLWRCAGTRGRPRSRGTRWRPSPARAGGAAPPGGRSPAARRPGRSRSRRRRRRPARCPS